MPARTYRVALQNAVSLQIPLKLIDSHVQEGDWTAGGWTPPSSIDKNSSNPGIGQWQSESTSFPIQGTEGYVVYEIEDAMANFQSGNTLFSGKQNQVTIHWSNPVVGNPKDPDFHFKEDGDIYTLQTIWRSSGPQNELPDFTAPLGPIIAFFGEVDNPLVVMALKVDPTHDVEILSFSIRRAFAGADLSQGIRQLRPTNNSISPRDLISV